MFYAPTKAACCDPCRLRHYKCDGDYPECYRCKRSGKKCTRSRNVRFRSEKEYDKSRFPRHQIWLSYPPRVQFINETADIANEFHIIPTEHTPSFDEKAGNAIAEPYEDSSPSVDEPTAIPSGLHHAAAIVRSAQKEIEHPPLSSPDPVTWNQSSQTIHSRQQRQDEASDFLTGPNYDSHWPLRDLQQALLLQHFVDKISPFFDFCDRERHFAVEVPQCAKQSATLFNAVLALSARHMSRTTNFDPYVSDHYYRECLKTLIPALDDQEASSDDNLLAATVILRLLEEFDVPLVGSDLQGHSIGTQSFIRSQEDYPKAPGLRQSAYWAGVRQEIYISATLQRAPSFQPTTDQYNIDRSLQASDDCTWANRAIVHCADVLEFSFGHGSRSVSLYQSLVEFNQRWRELRPASFDPIFSRERSSSESLEFPDIRYHMDWHVMGYQYLTLGHILLLVYDPRIPRVGPAHKAAVNKVDFEVKRDVWTLCGVGISNPTTPPAILVACMAINLCGDRFTLRQEQEQLLEVLIRTERLHGWPTVSTQATVKDVWGWSS